MCLELPIITTKKLNYFIIKINSINIIFSRSKFLLMRSYFSALSNFLFCSYKLLKISKKKFKITKILYGKKISFFLPDLDIERRDDDASANKIKKPSEYIHSIFFLHIFT